MTYDPKEPTRIVRLSSWECAALYRLMQSPAAAVHGDEGHMRALALSAKLSMAITEFADAGQLGTPANPNNPQIIEQQSIIAPANPKPPARKKRAPKVDV